MLEPFLLITAIFQIWCRVILYAIFLDFCWISDMHISAWTRLTLLITYELSPYFFPFVIIVPVDIGSIGLNFKMQGFQKLELQNMSSIIVIQSEQVFDNFQTLCFKSQKNASCLNV